MEGWQTQQLAYSSAWIWTRVLAASAASAMARATGVVCVVMARGFVRRNALLARMERPARDA